MRHRTVVEIIIFATSLLSFVSCRLDNLQFNYENKIKKSMTKIKKQIALMSGHQISRYQYPEPLPSSSKSPYAAMHTPYENIKQGTRRPGDKRIYNQKFEYQPQNVGHSLFCKKLFNCVLTYLEVLSEGGIPTLVQGGVGYTHFSVMVRAAPGTKLSGRIRAFCIIYKEKTIQPVRKPLNYSATAAEMDIADYI